MTHLQFLHASTTAVSCGCSLIETASSAAGLARCCSCCSAYMPDAGCNLAPLPCDRCLHAELSRARLGSESSAGKCFKMLTVGLPAAVCTGDFPQHHAIHCHSVAETTQASTCVSWIASLPFMLRHPSTSVYLTVCSGWLSEGFPKCTYRACRTQDSAVIPLALHLKSFWPCSGVSRQGSTGCLRLKLRAGAGSTCMVVTLPGAAFCEDSLAFSRRCFM